MPAYRNSPPAPTRAPRRTRLEQGVFYEHVVLTSLQLFAEGGYDAISMRKLAAQVGVPPMSLYRYFPTKAHLIRHIWDDVLARAHARATQEAHQHAAGPQRLRGYVDGFVQYWLENRAHCAVVFAVRDDLNEPAAEDGAPALQPNPQQLLQTLGELFDDCVAPGRLAPDERQHAVELIFCKALGFLLNHIWFGTSRWRNGGALKARLLDDIVATLPAQPRGVRRG